MGANSDVRANQVQVMDAIRGIVEDALNSAIPESWEVAEHATQRILAAIGAGGQAVAVKPLELSMLLRDAFLSGRGLKDGDKLSDEDQAAWMKYDPERMNAYHRISSALSQPHPADERVVSCVACEDHPKAPNDPCAVCGRATVADERVVEALRIGRSYVLDAMRNDGGIENCEIGYRADYEKIHSALAVLSAREGR